MEHKAAFVVIFSSALIHMNSIGSDTFIYHSGNEDGTLAYIVSQGAAYLLYPLLGWLADVYFTRHKFVLASFVILILTSLMTIVAVCFFLMYSSERSIAFTLGGITIVIGLTGLGMFEATAIQFGMDQLLEVSSNKLSTFIYWYYWSSNLGQLFLLYVDIGVLVYFSMCTIGISDVVASSIPGHIRPFENLTACVAILIMAFLQLVCACVGLCLIFCSKKHLNIDRTGEHPLKLIYQVLKYAWKHKCPENRSAFTYWEEDIPPRIDLGKRKYGGPFTTEEVEDTKTFLRILLLLFSLVGFHLSGHGYNLMSQLMKDQCPSKWVLGIVGDPMHFTILTVLIGIPIFYYWLSAKSCCSRYFPNMLKRMGFGLLCCLVKEIIELIIHATMVGPHKCRHVDHVVIDSCYFLVAQLNMNGSCLSIPELTDNYFICNENNTPFLLLLMPNILQGLSFLLVFMTALEFICAQAPLRLKGLLIGVWYASLAVNYLLVEVPGFFITDGTVWEVFHEVKAFIIFSFLVLYLHVSKHYSYRKRDEVMNEQYLIEEIYERELSLAEEHEQQALLDSTSSVHVIQSVKTIKELNT